MADAPDTSTYLLLFNDPALPVSRSIALGTGLTGFDTGAGGTYTIAATDMLQSVENLPNLSRGFIIKIGSNEVTTRVFTSADDSVTITNPDGVAGDIDFAVAPDQTIQRIQFLNNGVLAATRPAVNFTATGLAGLTLTDNPGSNRLDLNISMTGSASEASTYILKAADSGLPNSISLDSLGGPGLLKFGADGTPSKAIIGTDYQAGSPLLTAIAGLTPTNGSIISGNGTTFIGIAVGAAGTVPTSNGTSWSWQPNSDDTADWSEFPALQDVDMSGFVLTNIDGVHFRDNGSTGGITFEIGNNSGSDPSLRLNRFLNGIFQQSGFLYDSVLNPPPGPSNWASFPALTQVDVNSQNIINVANCTVNGNFNAVTNTAQPLTTNLVVTPNTFTVQDYNGNWAIRVGDGTTDPAASDVKLCVTAGDVYIGVSPYTADLNVTGVINANPVFFQDVASAVVAPSGKSALFSSGGQLYVATYTANTACQVVSVESGGLPAPAGRIPVSNGTNYDDLPIGSDGQVLTVSGSAVTWQSISALRQTEYLAFAIDTSSIPGGSDPVFSVTDTINPAYVLKTPTLPVNVNQNLFLYYDTTAAGNQNAVGLDISPYPNGAQLQIYVKGVGASTQNTINYTGRTFFYTNSWTSSADEFDFGGTGAVIDGLYYFDITSTTIYVTKAN